MSLVLVAGQKLTRLPPQLGVPHTPCCGHGVAKGWHGECTTVWELFFIFALVILYLLLPVLMA